MTQHLVRYDAARSALAECRSVDEVKDIRDKAEAMAAYARQAKDSELIEWATEIKVRAERQAGGLLAQAEKNAGARGLGKSAVAGCDSTPPTLADLGISRTQSSRWQRLAAIPAKHFETAVETAKAAAGEVTTAFMLREAQAFLTPRKAPEHRAAEPKPAPRVSDELVLARREISAWEAWFRELAAALGVPEHKGMILHKVRGLVRVAA